MLALKIILILFGLAFSLFGYFIYFKKKYFLINGFQKDFRSGRKTGRYAQIVGLVELIFGIACLLAGIVLILLI